MNKVQITFIQPAIWAMKIVLCLSVLNATSIFSKPQLRRKKQAACKWCLSAQMDGIPGGVLMDCACIKLTKMGETQQQ